MEFPKMIYLGGEHGAEHRIVADQAEQDAAKADGFLPLGETAKATEPAVTREAPAVASPGDAAAEQPEQPEQPEQAQVADKGALLARAKALGIPAKGTWGEARLIEEIAKAEAPQP